VRRKIDSTLRDRSAKKLAMMDHPNIAKVLDAGSIKFGQHTFSIRG
jgi:hypothetical protein